MDGRGRLFKNALSQKMTKITVRGPSMMAIRVWLDLGNEPHPRYGFLLESVLQNDLFKNAAGRPRCVQEARLLLERGVDPNKRLRTGAIVFLRRAGGVRVAAAGVWRQSQGPAHL